MAIPVLPALGALLFGGLLSKKPKAPSAFLTREEAEVYNRIWQDILGRIQSSEDPQKALMDYIYGPALSAFKAEARDQQAAMLRALGAMGASGAATNVATQMGRQFLKDYYTFLAQANRAPIDLISLIRGGGQLAVATTGSPGRDFSDIGTLLALLAFNPIKTIAPATAPSYSPGTLSLLSPPNPFDALTYNRFNFNYSGRGYR